MEILRNEGLLEPADVVLFEGAERSAKQFEFKVNTKVMSNK